MQQLQTILLYINDLEIAKFSTTNDQTSKRTDRNITVSGHPRLGGGLPDPQLEQRRGQGFLFQNEGGLPALHR